jgi:hypothetical protein
LTTSQELTDTLKNLTEEDFQQYFQAWKDYFQQCVAAKGNYFDADHVEM